VRVFDSAGRVVRTLVDRDEAAGFRECAWDGRDERGRPVASGVYFLRAETGDSVVERRAVLLR
jgi:flagellar hook assembly protein FlgD